MARNFWVDESGAVTVDWVVSTAAVVGMGMASAAAVRTGTGSLGDTIRAALESTTLDSWAMAQQIVSQNFANGDFSGWSMARHQVFGAWGDMLGPFGNETLNNPLTHSIALPEGATSALVQFDLIVADSWDGASTDQNRALGHTTEQGDSIRFLLDGQVITTEHFLGGGSNSDSLRDRQGTVQIGDATYNMTMTLKDNPAHVGGAGWMDQRWSVSIEATNPPGNLQLGLSSTANQSTIHNANTTAHDESFGIQNFSVKAR